MCFLHKNWKFKNRQSKLMKYIYNVGVLTSAFIPAKENLSPWINFCTHLSDLMMLLCRSITTLNNVKVFLQRWNGRNKVSHIGVRTSLTCLNHTDWQIKLIKTMQNIFKFKIYYEVENQKEQKPGMKCDFTYLTPHIM